MFAILRALLGSKYQTPVSPGAQPQNEQNRNPKGFSKDDLQRLEDVADRHVWNNRKEILASESCMCTECYLRFQPSQIARWQDGVSAVCPNPECGFGGSVIGSASGLDFDDYDYSAYVQKGENNAL